MEIRMLSKHIDYLLILVRLVGKELQILQRLSIYVH
jgi:hypothetical protein